MTDSYVGSSCHGSVRSSSDFQSSVASPASARSALLSRSFISAHITDHELFATATSVVPNLRAVLKHRNDGGRRSSSMWQRPLLDRQQPPPCWIVRKQKNKQQQQYYSGEITEFDRARLPSMQQRGDTRTATARASAVDTTRHSMVETRGSLHTRNAFVDEPTSSTFRWPRDDPSVTYAASAQVTLNCRLEEANDMLFGREAHQFDASMAALFGARKYRSGDRALAREFHDHGSSYWEDDDGDDRGQPGWVAMQSVVLRPRRSLNPVTAAKRTSRRQRLCFAVYSQHCPDTNEAFYTMKTLPKSTQDHFARCSRDQGAAEQALRGTTDHIAAGYHLTSLYSDLSGHQTRIVMTAYVCNIIEGPVTTDVLRSRSKLWPRSHQARSSGSSHRQDLPPTANAEAKYVVKLLANATTSFEQLVRRRRFGNQSFLHVPPNYAAARDDVCKVCRKTFGLLRPQRFCQLCAQCVCRECSHKFDVEPIARRVRRTRICYPCAANVDASVFQQENPLLNASFSTYSAVVAPVTRRSRMNRKDEGDNTARTKVSTASHDLLLERDDVSRYSHSSSQNTAEATAIPQARCHRLSTRRQVHSNSAITTSAPCPSTPGRQLADALFSSNPLTRARALQVVRQVVKQVASDSSVPTSSASSSASSSYTSSIPVNHPQHPDRNIVDKYLEACLRLSSISRSGDPATTDRSTNVQKNAPSAFYKAAEGCHRRRRSTSGQCYASSTDFDLNSRPPASPRPLTPTRTTLQKSICELDLDEDLDSAALDSICDVAAVRMRCSTAFIVAVNKAHESQAQRVVGASGAPRTWTEDAVVCPFSLIANGKPFMVTDPLRDPALRNLRLVRDIGVRFFAGFPIKSPDGAVVACLCTVDANVRERISLEDFKAMHALSKLASDLFEEEVNPYTLR
uniref:FYVE-type domain-containing protein n=1 Tax=Peronospora matthiolae TaxID=2874970 RepID=A0AAV1T217_9STRA